MIFDPGNLSAIGFVKRPHGYQGKLKVVLYQELNISQKEPVFFEFQGKPVPFFLDQIEGNSTELVLSIDEIDSEEKANLYKGKEVFIQSETTPTIPTMEGWELWSDSNLIGPIVDWIDREAQPLLEVSYMDRSVLIPFTEDWLIESDPISKKLVMNLPEGLLDL